MDFVSIINAVRPKWVIAVKHHRCGCRWVKLRGELPVGSPAQIHIVEYTRGGADWRHGIA